MKSSSHDSHVPHGVGPPAQLEWLSSRMRYASRISPSVSKWIAETPPRLCPGVRKLNTSLLHT